MITNYIKTALRNLRKNPGYSFLNLAGLSVGLGACLLIALFVRYHLAFDAGFPHADRIYRVATEISINGTERRSGNLQGPMAQTFREEIPGVANSTRLKMMGKTLVEAGRNSSYETRILQADPSFFSFFPVSFLRGTPETALSDPGGIVLTHSAAEKYFGSSDPMGQTLVVGEDAGYRVTGVVADPPERSHITYEMLVNIPETLYGTPVNEWNKVSAFYTYLLLEEGRSADAVTRQIPQVLEGKMSERNLADTRFYLQPLGDIHLQSDLDWELISDRIFDIRYIYLFSAIGLLILLIAGINYVNLATARAAGRMKEIGIRKAAGAVRGQLFWQFATESMLLALGGAVVAVVLAEYLAPVVGTLLQQDLSAAALWTPAFQAAYWATGALVGLAAGLYPALYLSSFRPSGILKGDSRQVLSGESLRKGLVVFQFTVSLALIICTIVVNRQLNHFQTRNLGLNPDQVLDISLEAQGAQELGHAFADRLRSRGSIGPVSAASALPGQGGITLYLYPAGDDSEPLPVRYTQVDHRYLETLQIAMAAGRDFREDDRVRDEPPALINEAAAREMGWTPEEAVGKKFDRFRVLGVTEDFHYASFRERIQPMVLTPLEDDAPVHLAVRLPADGITETMDWIRSEWEQVAPGYPFQYSFLDDTFASLYRSESRLSRLFLGFTIVAVVVACAGLFGLVSFLCSKRSREIGIRKVLGATVPDIMGLLTTDYLRQIALAFVIATPLALWAMNRWLAEFAYRIEIGPLIVLTAAGVTLAIALATVSWQSARAALANPVDSLRSE